MSKQELTKETGNRRIVVSQPRHNTPAQQHTFVRRSQRISNRKDEEEIRPYHDNITRDCDHAGSTRKTSDGVRPRGPAAEMAVIPTVLQKGPITRSMSAAMKSPICVEPLLTTSRVDLRRPLVSKRKPSQATRRPDEQSAGPSKATAVDDQIVGHTGPQYVAQGQWATPRKERAQHYRPRMLAADPAQIEIDEQTDFLQVEHQVFENLLEGNELIKEAVRRIHIKHDPSHLLPPLERKDSDSDLSD